MGNQLYLEIAASIQNYIKEQCLHAGDKIPTEAVLQQMFNVSRTTIREAVKILCTENILSVQQGRGTFVSNHSDLSHLLPEMPDLVADNRLRQFLEARLLIEPQIAMCAAQSATKNEIAALDKNIREMTLQRDAHDQMVLLDVHFHKLVAICTGNEVLINLIPSICSTVT